MKINWGTALVIFFVFYIGNLVRVVFKSTTIDHSLVVDNYYDHDLNYQAKVDKINNRQLLAADLDIVYESKNKQLSLLFGTENKAKNASIEMYRASDKSSDFTQKLELSNEEASINLNNLAIGKWKVKVEWADDVRSYLKEKDIYIQ